MAVTTSYGFSSLKPLDPRSLTDNADAVALANGGAAVSGDQSGHTGVTVYKPDGDVLVSASITGTGSALTPLSGGNVVMVNDIGNDGFYGILNVATGAFSSGGLGETHNDLLNVDVAGQTAAAGGGFVVATQVLYNGTDNDIRIYMRDSAGSKVKTFSVDISGADDELPSIAALNDGGFAVAWQRNIDLHPGTGNQMWYAVYNADGSVRKAATALDSSDYFNRNASVVALKNGGFAIAYEDSSPSNNTGSDITLATLDAAGNVLGSADISQDGRYDAAPALTVLSNGMIAVGSVRQIDVFSDPDGGLTAVYAPIWTLIDQNTRAKLGESAIPASLDDIDLHPTVGAMANGQMAAFFTDPDTGQVVGQVLQAQRVSTGDAAANTITGDDLQDFINGNGGDDALAGGKGDDTLDGGTEADRMAGGLGDDTYVVDDAGDKITEKSGEGTDTVQSSINFSLAGIYAEKLELMGSATNATGNSLANTLTGNGGGNRLDGGTGADVMIGGDGADTYIVDNAGDVVNETAAGSGGVDLVKSSVAFTLGTNVNNLTLTGRSAVSATGNSSANVITGNSAANSLKGGTGDDTFVFSTALGPNNVDILGGFSQASGDNDNFNLGHTVFAGLAIGTLSAGALKEIASASSTVGVDSDDRILYDKGHGDLYFDRDGSGATYDRVKFAHIPANTVLTNADFIVV